MINKKNRRNLLSFALLILLIGACFSFLFTTKLAYAIENDEIIASDEGYLATDSDSVIRWFESSYPSHFRAIFSKFKLKIALLAVLFPLLTSKLWGELWGKCGALFVSYNA